MYVSRPIRAIRDNPISGESVTLLLRLADEADPAAVAEAVRTFDGTVEDELRFGDLLVTVDQETVSAICDIGGLAAVETDNVHGMDLDGAGEDVTY